MKIDDIEMAAILSKALRELPKVRKRLLAKPSEHYDAIALELQAADISDGVSQGSSAYFWVPASLAPKILDAVERVIRKKLKKIGVVSKQRATGK